MKKILCIVLILISCYSCKRDKTEYIVHDSEIFFDDDTLLIGKWDYLYTWAGGGYTGASEKKNENRPTLNIKPKGYYEMLRDKKILETGIIDTIGYMYNNRLVIFYPNGIKSPNIMPQTLHTLNIDTLKMGLGIHSDYYSDAYYVRVK